MVKRIAIIGDVNTDVILGRLTHLPEFGQEVLVGERRIRTAGAAGNTALALAALGATPLVVGVVGDDPEGVKIRSEFEAKGIDTRGIYSIPGGETGTSYGITSEDGERAFITYMGVLDEFSLPMIMSRYPLIVECDFILVTGYFLMPKITVDEWVIFFKQLKADGKYIALDSGWDPQGWPETVIMDIHRILASVNLFLPNAEELKQLSKKADAMEGSRMLLQTGVKEIAVKCGAHGSMLVNPVEAMIHPGFDSQVFDTVGAGDTFNAGLLYMLAKRQTHGLLEFANALAAMAISQSDREYASVAAVKEFIARNSILCQIPSVGKTSVYL